MKCLCLQELGWGSLACWSRGEAEGHSLFSRLVGLLLSWQLIKKTDSLSWDLLMQCSDVFPSLRASGGPWPSCGPLCPRSSQEELWVRAAVCTAHKGSFRRCSPEQQCLPERAVDGPRPSISGSPPELFPVGMQLELHALWSLWIGHVVQREMRTRSGCIQGIEYFGLPMTTIREMSNSE